MLQQSPHILITVLKFKNNFYIFQFLFSIYNLRSRFSYDIYYVSYNGHIRRNKYVLLN